METPELDTIVAEVSHSWPANTPDKIISRMFETVIETNRKRGYTLQEWKFNSTYIPPHQRDHHSGGQLNETIIAIFRKT